MAYTAKKRGFGDRLKVLIIKTGALGDVLRTTFVAKLLKKKYSDCSITWVTASSAQCLLEGNKYVDSVLVYPSDSRRHGRLPVPASLQVLGLILYKHSLESFGKGFQAYNM